MSIAFGIRKRLTIPFLLAAALLAATNCALADQPPASLWDAVFGSGAMPEIGAVVVMRVNPWIARPLVPRRRCLR